MSSEKKREGDTEVPEIVALDKFTVPDAGRGTAAIKRKKQVRATEQFTQEDLAELRRLAQEHDHDVDPNEDLGWDPEAEEELLLEVVRNEAVIAALGLDDETPTEDADDAAALQLQDELTAQREGKHIRIQLTPEQAAELRKIDMENKLPGQHSPVQILPQEGISASVESKASTAPAPSTPKAVRRSTRAKIRTALIVLGFVAAAGGAALATVKIKSCAGDKPAHHKNASAQE